MLLLKINYFSKSRAFGEFHNIFLSLFKALIWYVPVANWLWFVGIQLVFLFGQWLPFSPSHYYIVFIQSWQILSFPHKHTGMDKFQRQKETSQHLALDPRAYFASASIILPNGLPLANLARRHRQRHARRSLTIRHPRIHAHHERTPNLRTSTHRHSRGRVKKISLHEQTRTTLRIGKS